MLKKCPCSGASHIVICPPAPRVPPCNKRHWENKSTAMKQMKLVCIHYMTAHFSPSFIKSSSGKLCPPYLNIVSDNIPGALSACFAGSCLHLVLQALHLDLLLKVLSIGPDPLKVILTVLKLTPAYHCGTSKNSCSSTTHNLFSYQQGLLICQQSCP